MAGGGAWPLKAKGKREAMVSVGPLNLAEGMD